MASNGRGATWLAAVLVFIGCFIISIAIGQIVDDAAWAGFGVGAGFVLVGILLAVSKR